MGIAHLIGLLQGVVDLPNNLLSRHGRKLPSHQRFMQPAVNQLSEEIKDNLDLERWFRLPKSHERRIHGHRHAGVRIVQDGPTLVLALDAHMAHPGRFTAEDLLPYRTAREPPCQREALNRRKVMRKARSKKKRPILLAALERRYRETQDF